MLNKLPPYNFDQHYVKLVETNTYFLEMKNPNSEQVEIPDSVFFKNWLHHWMLINADSIISQLAKTGIGSTEWLCPISNSPKNKCSQYRDLPF